MSIDPVAEKSPRRWGKTEQTRRIILDAARDVFVEQGYSEANVSQIVERASLSVGSLYHHFDGKVGLFVALWEEFEAVYVEAARTAVADARQRGVTDPVELFIAGSRAYLDVAREHPELTLLFRGGDVPVGYSALGSRVGESWKQSNLTLLGLPDTDANRLRVRILTSVIVEGERSIAKASNAEESDRLANEILAIVRSIATVS